MRYSLLFVAYLLLAPGLAHPFEPIPDGFRETKLGKQLDRRFAQLALSARDDLWYDCRILFNTNIPLGFYAKDIRIRKIVFKLNFMNNVECIDVETLYDVDFAGLRDAPAYLLLTSRHGPPDKTFHGHRKFQNQQEPVFESGFLWEDATRDVALVFYEKHLEHPTEGVDSAHTVSILIMDQEYLRNWLGSFSKISFSKNGGPQGK
jgi:hypothetical protein